MAGCAWASQRDVITHSPPTTAHAVFGQFGKLAVYDNNGDDYLLDVI